MGSLRSPGKVTHPFAKTTIIEHIVKRIQLIKEFSVVSLAIPDLEKDDSLADIGRKINVNVVRGDENDVLSRFILAGEQLDVPYIARICGDCPWVDLNLAALLAKRTFETDADYIITEDPIPLGTGLEIVSLSALKTISRLTDESKYREHVTSYIHDHPDKFTRSVVPAPDYLRGKEVRLTVDTKEDLLFQDKLIMGLNVSEPCSLSLPEIFNHLDSRPELLEINAHVVQKDWRSPSK